MRHPSQLVLVLLGCSAWRLSTLAHSPEARPVAQDAGTPAIDTAPCAPPVADVPAMAAAATSAATGTVLIALPSGGTVTLDAQHPEHTATVTLGATERGESTTATPMANGSDPFHYEGEGDGDTPVAVECVVPEHTPEFVVTIAGSVPVLTLSVAGAANAGLLVSRQRPGPEVSGLIGGDRVSTASLRNPPAGTLSVTPVSLCSGRGTLTVRFALGAPAALPDPGPTMPPVGMVYASFHAEAAGTCGEGWCERWSVQLRGAVTRLIPAGRAVSSLPLHRTIARLAGPSVQPGFEAETSGRNDDVLGWRVRAEGSTWVIEHSVSGRAWRRAGTFTLPVGVALEPDPDGVVS